MLIHGKYTTLTSIYVHVYNYVHVEVCLCIYVQSKKNGFEELGHVTKFGLKILYSTVLGKTYSGKNADIAVAYHCGHVLMNHLCMVQSYTLMQFYTTLL